MKSLREKKIELLQQQQKALKNKLYPQDNPINFQSQESLGLSLMGSQNRKRVSLREVKIDNLQSQSSYLKKPHSKKSAFQMFK